MQGIILSLSTYRLWPPGFIPVEEYEQPPGKRVPSTGESAVSYLLLGILIITFIDGIISHGDLVLSQFLNLA